ncbi:MAG: hypothetical protein VX498_00520 [Myxococcota bacterium]|nr:hypothetical protein [Myxococcota bacterium]
MTLLLYSSDARPETPDGARLAALLAQVESARPDAFVLAVCREPPAELLPHPLRDWVCLGGELSTEAQGRLLARIAGMHEAPLVVLLGEEAEALIRSPEAEWSANPVFFQAAQADSELERLASLMAEHLPLSLVLGPNSTVAPLIEELGKHPDLPAVHLYWEGGLVRELLDLAAVVQDAYAGPIRLQVGLRDVVRGEARRILVGIPREIELRLVAEDELAIGAAAATERLLRRVRRERPRGDAR